MQLLRHRCAARALAAACWAALLASSSTALAQTPLGTGFTYQGVLKSNNSVYSGNADLRFMLFDAAGGGNQIGATMEYPSWPIVDGQFTIVLDFGALAFNGDERWLAIEVRAPAGSGSYAALSPRQRLTAAPYALRALNASISGVQPAALTFSNVANDFVGSSLDIDSGTLHVDAANNRVGIGVLAPTHALTIASPGDPYALRLMGPLGAYQHGARLNFGDGDYAFIEEDIDDALRIQANRLLVTSPYTGDFAVVLPNGSVSAAESFDEPGLAHARQTGVLTTLTPSYLPTLTRTINCPAAGYVIATATGTVRVGGVAGGNTVQLDVAPEGTLIANNPQEIVTGGTPLTTVATVHRVYAVKGAGAYGYSLMARETVNSFGLSIIKNPTLTLLCVPTAYGAVDQ